MPRGRGAHAARDRVPRLPRDPRSRRTSAAASLPTGRHCVRARGRGGSVRTGRPRRVPSAVPLSPGGTGDGPAGAGGGGWPHPTRARRHARAGPRRTDHRVGGDTRGRPLAEGPERRRHLLDHPERCSVDPPRDLPRGRRGPTAVPDVRTSRRPPGSLPSSCGQGSRRPPSGTRSPAFHAQRWWCRRTRWRRGARPPSTCASGCHARRAATAASRGPSTPAAAVSSSATPTPGSTTGSWTSVGTPSSSRRSCRSRPTAAERRAMTGVLHSIELHTGEEP